MFAVVEFDNKKKEYSIIPLIWLSDDKSSCLWPKNVKSDAQLQTLIEELSQPKPSWSHYTIKQIHVTKDTYSEASSALQLIITESSSSATDIDSKIIDEEQIEQIAEQVVASDNNVENYEDDSRKKRKKKVVKKQLQPNTGNMYSSDSDDQTTNPPQKKRVPTVHFSDINVSCSEEEFNEADKYNNSEKFPTPSASLSHHSDRQSTCGTDFQIHHKIGHYSGSSVENRGSASLTPLSSRNSSPITHSLRNDLPTSQNVSQLNQWQQNIIQDLEKIKAVQDQQSTLLSQIWQAMQVKNIRALQRPSDVPDLPIDRSKDFGNFEKWLETKENYVYMRTRLSSIGGTTVRVAVMNMMKFIITNKLGMAFNWAGSAPKAPNHKRKYAFKETNACKIINEATKICFQGAEQSRLIVGDSTDKAISQACQDWLKQSKHRFQNSNC